MPVFILTAYQFVKDSKALKYVLLAILAAGIVWAAIAVTREWIATGKQDAVEMDRNDISLQASNRVIEAMTVADANQAARDETQANEQKELQREIDTKGTAAPVGPAVSGVMQRLREQQARRGN